MCTQFHAPRSILLTRANKTHTLHTHTHAYTQRESIATRLPYTVKKVTLQRHMLSRDEQQEVWSPYAFDMYVKNSRELWYNTLCNKREASGAKHSLNRIIFNTYEYIKLDRTRRRLCKRDYYSKARQFLDRIFMIIIVVIFDAIPAYYLLFSAPFTCSFMQFLRKYIRDTIQITLNHVEFLHKIIRN